MARPARLLFLVLLAATAACDFGETGNPAAPDQSSVAYVQTDLTVGTGTEAAAGMNATVQYAAWLYSETAPDHKGTQIDQNQFAFVIGAGQVIKGFDQGVVGMKVGGTRRLVVPPSLAYGSSGYQSIPPNAALVFDIGLATLAAPSGS